MANLLRHLDVLAQGSDAEEWVNILFIVVMAILWLGGGLIKAAGRKGSQQRRGEDATQKRGPAGETWQQRLARRAEEMQRAAEAKRREMAERVRRMEEGARSRTQDEGPRPAGGSVTVRSGPRGESILVYEKAREQISPEQREYIARQREAKEAVAAARHRQASPVVPRIETGIPEGRANAVAEPPKSPAQKKESAEPPRESLGIQPGDLIDYADPDALKKAILHYEVFGRPLALRDPAAQIMPL